MKAQVGAHTCVVGKAAAGASTPAAHTTEQAANPRPRAQVARRPHDQAASQIQGVARRGRRPASAG
jgi:hypothetical protein